MAVVVLGVEILHQSVLNVQGVEISFVQPMQIQGVELLLNWQPYNLAPEPPFSVSVCEAEVIQKAASDSASGIDIVFGPGFAAETASGDEAAQLTGSGNESKSALDTGIGVDTFTVSGSETLSVTGFDTGLGSEFGTIGVTGQDAATGMETLLAPALVLDSASGLDVLSLSGSETLSVLRTDSGVGVDSASVSGQITASDVGAGLDLGGNVREALDSGSGSVSGIVGIIATDLASGTEFAFLASADLVITDAGSGIDRGFGGPLATDSASGLDEVFVPGFATDTASGLDSASAIVQISALDSASGIELAFLSSGAHFAFDTGSGDDGETFLSSGFFELTESATGTDFAYGPAWVLDDGVAVDTVATSAFLTASDSGVGRDLACLSVEGPLGPPVLRIGPDTRLPRWNTGHVNPNSTLFRILQRGLAEQVIPLKETLRRAFLRRWLTVSEVGETRLEWMVPFAIPETRECTFTFSTETAMGTVSGSIRQAVSAFDYETSVEPVWWADPLKRQLRFRNLAMKVSTRYSTSEVYTICGELDGLIPDVGVYYRRHPSNYWEWINPEGPAMTGDFFVLPGTGHFQIAYGSRTLLAALETGTISATYPGGRSIDLTPILKKPANVFDGYGSILGIPRFLDEDNLAYKRRMLNEVVAPPDVTIDGVIRGVASQLGRLTHQIWNGVTTLVLDTTGASAITSVTVVGVDRLREISEELTPSADKRHFTATYPNWRAGYIVFVDGMPEQSATLSGNVITLSRPVSGTVTATYSIEQYRLVAVASGYIGQLQAGTGLASGSYEILYARGVNAHTVDLPDFIEQKLLTPDGLANRLFLDLSAELTRENRTTFGRARWGKDATWLSEDGDQPKTARLPIPLDFNLDE